MEKTSKAVVIDLATESDIDAIQKIAKQNRKTIGNMDVIDLMHSIKNGSVSVAKEKGLVVGFIHWEFQSGGVAFIYQICVADGFRRKGVGELLFCEVPSPKQGRCYVDNEANTFAQQMGGVVIGNDFSNGKAVHIYEWN